MKQENFHWHCLCIGFMLTFAGCASIKSTKCVSGTNGVFLPDNSFVYRKDTLCVKHTTYKECWTTKDYAKLAHQVRANGDTISPYLWDRVMYDRVQYMGISDDTRTMILSAGGADGILKSCFSEQNYTNTIRNNESRFIVDFIVSLADMNILEYGFELSWNNKSLQLTPTEIKNLLDFIHTIQLTYSGGEQFRDETIIFSMNLHRLK